MNQPGSRGRAAARVVARLALAAALLAPGPAAAVPTATFDEATFAALRKGKPQGTAITSEGEVIAGRSAARLGATRDVLIFSRARGADGTVYFGTGRRGLLLAVRDGKVRKVADLKTVLVSALAPGPRGHLLAATMPGARLLDVDPRRGTFKEIARLPAAHIWAIVHDGRAGRIYVATGAPGKLFVLPARGGKPRVLFDPKEKHLLCLTRDARGDLLAGSATRAVLYRISPAGKATAVHDFDGQELRDVVAARDGTLYVAVNKFPRKTSGVPRFDRPAPGRGGTAIPRRGATVRKPSAQAPRPQDLRPGAKRGKGALFRIGPEGRVEPLLTLDRGYFTDLALDPAGVVWAAEGSEGKVFQVRQGRVVASVLDLPERQVLALAVAGAAQYLGTGDAGAIYRLKPAAATRPVYLSRVMDARFRARWGRARLRGDAALAVASRTGNTAKPDATWSPWKASPVAGKGGWVKVTSAAARYLQLRFTWRGRTGALRAFRVHYRPQNQRARVTGIKVARPRPPKKGRPAPATLKISWRVDNPDGDKLVYRLAYQEEGGGPWRPITDPKAPLSTTSYTWRTDAVPDGVYRIRVEASDERANGPGATLRHARVTGPELVDNRRPLLAELGVAFPWVKGVARDSFSPLRAIEISLDGGPFRLVEPTDGVFDNREERFRYRLPAGLRPGVHLVSVRVRDDADNTGVRNVAFRR